MRHRSALVVLVSLGAACNSAALRAQQPDSTGSLTFFRSTDLLWVGGFAIASYGISRFDPRIAQYFQRYTPGGVIVPAVLRPVDARDLIEKLKGLSAESASGIPLLVGTDLYNLPRGRNAPNAFFPQLPSLMSLAAANDPDASARLGGLLADDTTA